MSALSTALKSEALSYFRYIRRFPIVCTEAGPWNADVLGLNARTAVEVEVKTSLQDLRAEFRNKQAKHWVYGESRGRGAVPNLFYFLIPDDLQEPATDFLAGQQGLGQQAGLLVAPRDRSRWLLSGRNLTLVRKAPRIHEEPPAEALVRRALQRMGSELCTTRLGLEQLSQRLEATLAAVEAQNAAAVVRLDGGLDLEDADAFVEARARELQRAVHPEARWEALDADQQRNWRDAAQRLWDAQAVDIGDWKRLGFLS